MAELKPGDEIRPGFTEPNDAVGDVDSNGRRPFAYATSKMDMAKDYARKSVQAARERGLDIPADSPGHVYSVEPTWHFHEDPEHYGRNGGKNPVAFRSQDPFRVISEVQFRKQGL